MRSMLLFREHVQGESHALRPCYITGWWAATASHGAGVVAEGAGKVDCRSTAWTGCRHALAGCRVISMHSSHGSALEACSVEPTAREPSAAWLTMRRPQTRQRSQLRPPVLAHSSRTFQRRPARFAGRCFCYA